jgi:hypothetical protein
MSVDMLIVCQWLGRSCQQTEILNPTWDQVEEAIRRLDNRVTNDLYLQPHREDPETYLCVGGGQGRYTVSGSVNNETFPTVLDASKAALPKELLVVGGQSGWYPASMVHDLETALEASFAYFECGGPGGRLNWQEPP